MKKLLAIAIISLILVTAAVSVDYIEITFRIPVDKAPEFLSGFLAMNPIPTLQDSNDPNEGIPQYTTKEWIKMCGRDYYMRVYRNGKDRLAASTAVKDPNIFE